MLNIAILLSIFSGMFILLLTFIAPNVSATTWYVHPGESIQYCIDYNASAGDTIYVYAGTYEEIITIHSYLDHLTLEGESRDTTTIDAQGSGTVITVSASWCN